MRKTIQLALLSTMLTISCGGPKTETASTTPTPAPSPTPTPTPTPTPMPVPIPNGNYAVVVLANNGQWWHVDRNGKTDGVLKGLPNTAAMEEDFINQMPSGAISDNGDIYFYSTQQDRNYYYKNRQKIELPNGEKVRRIKTLHQSTFIMTTSGSNIHSTRFHTVNGSRDIITTVSTDYEETINDIYESTSGNDRIVLGTKHFWVYNSSTYKYDCYSLNTPIPDNVTGNLASGERSLQRILFVSHAVPTLAPTVCVEQHSPTRWNGDVYGYDSTYSASLPNDILVAGQSFDMACDDDAYMFLSLGNSTLALFNGNLSSAPDTVNYNEIKEWTCIVSAGYIDHNTYSWSNEVYKAGVKKDGNCAVYIPLNNESTLFVPIGYALYPVAISVR